MSESFWPQDTRKDLYIDRGSGKEGNRIWEMIQEKWPGIKMNEFYMSAEHIHTKCLTYDLYDSSDYTDFIRDRGGERISIESEKRKRERERRHNRKHTRTPTYCRGRVFNFQFYYKYDRYNSMDHYLTWVGFQVACNIKAGHTARPNLSYQLKSVEYSCRQSLQYR